MDETVQPVERLTEMAARFQADVDAARRELDEHGGTLGAARLNYTLRVVLAEVLELADMNAAWVCDEQVCRSCAALRKMLAAFVALHGRDGVQ